MELDFGNEISPASRRGPVHESRTGAAHAQEFGFLCLYPVKDVIIRPIYDVIFEVFRCEGE